MCLLYCYTVTDTDHNKCDTDPESWHPLTKWTDYIYTAGSIVWAKSATHPWWPALVTQHPDQLDIRCFLNHRNNDVCIFCIPFAVYIIKIDIDQRNRLR